MTNTQRNKLFWNTLKGLVGGAALFSLSTVALAFSLKNYTWKLFSVPKGQWMMFDEALGITVPFLAIVAVMLSLGIMSEACTAIYRHYQNKERRNRNTNG